MSDTPNNIVQLDVLRINRNATKKCTCRNRGFVVDPKNKEITCDKCDAKVDPFDALFELANNHERLNAQHEALRQQRQELQAYKPWLLEVRKFESQYRNHKMLPCCPQCGKAFYLKEIKSWTSAEYEERRRKSEKERLDHERP